MNTSLCLPLVSIYCCFFLVYEAKEEKTDTIEKCVLSFQIAIFSRETKNESQKSLSNEWMENFDFGFDLTIRYVWRMTDTNVILDTHQMNKKQA